MTFKVTMERAYDCASETSIGGYLIVRAEPRGEFFMLYCDDVVEFRLPLGIVLNLDDESGDCQVHVESREGLEPWASHLAWIEFKTVKPMRRDDIY